VLSRRYKSTSTFSNIFHAHGFKNAGRIYISYISVAGSVDGHTNASRWSCTFGEPYKYDKWRYINFYDTLHILCSFVCNQNLYQTLLKRIIPDKLSKRGSVRENDVQQCLMKRRVKQSRNVARGIRLITKVMLILVTIWMPIQQVWWRCLLEP